MKEPTIVNYIDISGETLLLDSLTDEKSQKAREVMQERLMEPMGYKRKTA